MSYEYVSYQDLADQITKDFLNGRFASASEFKKLSGKIKNTIISIKYTNSELQNSWDVIEDAICNEQDKEKINKIIKEVSNAFKSAIDKIVEEKSFWNLDFQTFFEILDRALNIISIAFGYESHGMMWKGKIRVKADLLILEELTEHKIDTSKIDLKAIREKFLSTLGKITRLFPEKIIEEDKDLMATLVGQDNGAKIKAVKTYIAKTPNSFYTFLFKNIGNARNVYIDTLIPMIKSEDINHDFRLLAIGTRNLALVQRAFQDYQAIEEPAELPLASQSKSKTVKTEEQKLELLRRAVYPVNFNEQVASYLLEQKVFDAEDIKNLLLSCITNGWDARSTKEEPINWVLSQGWSPKKPSHFHSACGKIWVNNDTPETQGKVSNTFKILMDNGLIDKDNNEYNYTFSLFNAYNPNPIARFIMTEYSELSVQKIKLNTIKVNYDNPESEQNNKSRSAEDGVIKLVTETINNKDYAFLKTLFNHGLGSNFGKKLTAQINQAGYEEVQKLVEEQKKIEDKLHSYADALEAKIIGKRFANSKVRAEINGQIYNYLIDMNCDRVSPEAKAEIAEMLKQDPKSADNKFVKNFNMKIALHQDVTNLFYDIISNLITAFNLGNINKGRVQSASFVEKLATETPTILKK